jgi:hypothetical protein
MAKTIHIEERTEEFIKAYNRLKTNGELPSHKDLMEILEVNSISTISEILAKRQNISPSAWKNFKNHFAISDNSEVKNVDGIVVLKNEIVLIEIKTASGKTLKIAPEGKTEIELLNAFLEERERIITEKEQRQKDAEQRAEKSEDEKKELYKALAETRATINGVLTTILTNLTDIKGDTHAGLAYQKAWVEFVAESEAKGDQKKKDQIKANMNKLLAQSLGVIPKKDKKSDVSN